MTIEAFNTNTQAATLDEKIKYAELLATSGLIPQVYRDRPGNVLTAIEYGQALGVAPIVALNQITVVNGGVSMEAKLMMSLARKAGHSLHLEGDDTHAKCTIIRADDRGREITSEWDKAKAEKAGLWGKGHWAKNPGLMLKYRAAAECIRLGCPEVLAGITYTPEELAEIRATNDQKVAVRVTPAPVVEKTAQDYMRSLRLSGKAFKAFAERALGVQVKAWAGLDEDDQGTVLAALAAVEATGVDPTVNGATHEVVDGELVETTTGEITEA